MSRARQASMPQRVNNSSKNKREKWIQPNRLEIIYSMRVAGKTDIDIADHIGIGVPTLNRWIKEMPEFAAAMEVSNEGTVARVEHSLIKMCLGQTVEETKVTIEDVGRTGKKGDNSPKMRQKTEITTKYIPPSFNAIQFYLINNAPDVYKKNRDIVPVDIQDDNIQINIVTVSGRNKEKQNGS